MQPDKISLYIGMPCHDGKLHVGTHISILKMIELCRACNIGLAFDMPMGDAEIGHARNLIAANFLKTDFTHLLFIDSDVVFHDQAIIRLIEADKDVIGAAYPKKQEGETQYPVVAPFGPVDNNCCQEVMGTGAGFMLIKREALEKFAAYHPNAYYQENGEKKRDFFCPQTIDGKRASEDLAFCILAREAGIQVWMRRDIPMGHIGNRAWSGCYEVTEQQKMKVAAE